MAQVIGNLFGISLLADADAAWLGVDLGRIGEDLAAHPFIYYFLVFNVVVREKAKHQQAHDQECRHRCPDNGTPQAIAEAFHARDFDFNCQLLRRSRLFLSDAWRARALPAGAEKSPIRFLL
jgi:hypothetical protein